MVYLITGKQGAGKTEYALRLCNELLAAGHFVIHLDGDDFRRSTNNQDFSDAGRIKNLTDAAEIASAFEDQGKIVVMSFIAPRREWRYMMRALWKRSRVVYIPGGKLWEGTGYDVPLDDELNLLINQ